MSDLRLSKRSRAERSTAFNGKQMPLSFFSDWLKVAEDEAKQYVFVCNVR